MATRRVTRSSKQQGSETIGDHFLPSRSGISMQPGKSIEDKAPSTLRRSKRAPAASSIEVTVSLVEEETLPLKKEERKKELKPSRNGITVQPGKSLEDKAPPTTPRSNRAPASRLSSIEVTVSLVEEETLPQKKEEPKDELKGIHLPKRYKELHDRFKAMETIASLFDTAGKTLTFNALSQEVKRLSRRLFSFDEFAQVIAVYPQAYHVKVKKISCVGDRVGGVRSARWEHVIKPNLDDDLLIVSLRPEEPCVPKPVEQMQSEAAIDSRKRLEGWRISRRQQVFRSLLARRVITAHDEFIKERNLEIPEISTFLPVFHNYFIRKIDSVCPHIEKAAIEEIPEEEKASASHQGMGDFMKSEAVSGLQKALSRLSILSPGKKTTSPRGAAPSPKLLPSSAKVVRSPAIIIPSPPKVAETTKPMTVLERIRARAEARKAAEMARDPEMENKLADLVRLLDNKIICLIFDIYQSNSRRSMEISDMVDRIDRSGKLAKEKVPSLLTRLASLVSSHFSIETPGGRQFLRVTDNSPNAKQQVVSVLKKELDACRKKATAKSCASPKSR